MDCSNSANSGTTQSRDIPKRARARPRNCCDAARLQQQFATHVRAATARLHADASATKLGTGVARCNCAALQRENRAEISCAARAATATAAAMRNAACGQFNARLIAWRKPNHWVRAIVFRDSLMFLSSTGHFPDPLRPP